MELAEYLAQIWRRKWVVIGITVLVTFIDVIVLLILPRYYKASSVVEVGMVQSLLANPGQARDTSRQTLPSAVQAITETYLKLLESPSVGEEAKRRTKTQLAYSEQTVNGNSVETSTSPTGAAAENIEFDFSSHAEAIRESGTDLIYIDVTADKPEVAKVAADALAAVLIEQASKLGSEVADSFVENIQKQQIDPIDKRLAEIREESEKLKATSGGDVASRNVRIANLADEAKELDDTRKQYTDIIARVRLNEALNKNNLRLLSPAVAPVSKETPPLLKTGAVAAVVGLLISVLVVLIIDRRKVVKPATIF